MGFRKPSPEEISSFYRQTAGMIRCGISPADAVCALRKEEQELPRICRTAGQIKKDLSRSRGFEETLGRFPEVFSPVVTGILADGELENAHAANLLEKVADTEEHIGKGGRKLITALLYPLFVLLVAVGVILFLVTFVVPVFEDVFAGAGMRLPVLTRWVLGIGLFLKQWMGYILPVLLLAVVYLCFNRKLLWRIGSKLPRARVMQKNLSVFAFARYTGLLLSAGVPLPRAIDQSARSVRNLFYQERFSTLAQESRDTGTFLEAAGRSGLFPVMLLKSLEKNAMHENLETAMAQTASYYSRNLQSSKSGKFNFLEAAAIVIMGVVVGLLVISMYLPLFQSASMIS